MIVALAIPEPALLPQPILLPLIFIAAACLASALNWAGALNLGTGLGDQLTFDPDLTVTGDEIVIDLGPQAATASAATNRKTRFWPHIGSSLRGCRGKTGGGRFQMSLTGSSHSTGMRHTG